MSLPATTYHVIVCCKRPTESSYDVFFPSFSLAESSPRDLQITAESVLLQIIFCSYAIETSLLCENGIAIPRAGRE